MDYYLLKKGKQEGPFTERQLQLMVRTRQADRDTPMWYEGLSEWIPLSMLLDEISATSRPVASRVAPKAVESHCSRGIYIILALFLGGMFGVHNFYAGHYGSAALQLITTILGAIMIDSIGILLLIVVFMLVIGEVFVTKKDGKGRPFK